jgi:hypothetical protein
MDEPLIRAALQVAGIAKGDIDNLLGCWRTHGFEYVFGTAPPDTGRPAKYDAEAILRAVAVHLADGYKLNAALAQVATDLIGKEAKDVAVVERIYHEQKRLIEKYFESLR